MKRPIVLVEEVPDPIDIEAWADAYIRLIAKRRQVARPTVATPPVSSVG